MPVLTRFDLGIYVCDSDGWSVLPGISGGVLYIAPLRRFVEPVFHLLHSSGDT